MVEENFVTLCYGTSLLTETALAYSKDGCGQITQMYKKKTSQSLLFVNLLLL